MTRLLHALVLTTIFNCIAFAEHQYGLCRRSDCSCPDSVHPSWIRINCTVSASEKLDVFEGDVPDATTELVVREAEALMVGQGALSRLQDLRQLSVSGVRLVVIRSRAAVDLNVINAYVEVEDCEVLRVEEHAFSNIKGPLSVSIRNCDNVSLEGGAFSWLLKMNITNVKTLVLNAGAFTLDPTAANVGEHGPGMSIVMNNLFAPELPAQTFGSSAAEIELTSITVQAVRYRAFSANTYHVVKVVNSTFHLIEEESFASKSLINDLDIVGCRIHEFRSRALQSAISKLSILNTRFDIIETGAINSTVVSIKISDCEFHTFFTRGFEISSWSKLTIEKNRFDALPPHAIVAPPSYAVKELYFVDNEIENVEANSLEFIGHTSDGKYDVNVIYKSNYFGVPCKCSINTWLADAIGSKNDELYNTESYCTVDEYFARCFNVPEQNMMLDKFLNKVCSEESFIKCEEYKTKTDMPTEIKNPRFPHKKEQETLSDRDKKVIGIVIVTALGCIIIVMFVSLIRCMNRRGYCSSIKNILMSSNSSCGTICSRLCVCGRNNVLDNTRSISQLSVNEYSERRRLNEPRMQENVVMETVLPKAYTEVVPTLMDDKTTQTLPEELTKELLENLKEKLEDPENYVEAREMIEHLYELIKVEESCNTNSPMVLKTEENIYDLPFQNTTPRIGKNKKQMISVGTRTPSLDKLLPLSPYNRQTALAHEYFEPKDFAVHLYAEIANCDKEKRSLLGTIPDIVEQVVPRGPYLRAVREKKSSPNSSPSSKSVMSPISSPTSSNCSGLVQSPSTMKSIKSTTSNSSGKMMNRPLPEKPVNLDPGEGTSVAHG